jgi:glycerol 2-dehydrogenase (NADP+)
MLFRSCPQEEVVEFCRSKGIIVTAYSPLGSNDSPLSKNPVVLKLAEKHNVQPANILVSLQANRPGVNVIPKSVTPARIANNFTIVELSKEEMAELHAIDKEHHFRVCHPDWTGYGSLGFEDCGEDLQKWSKN